MEEPSQPQLSESVKVIKTKKLRKIVHLIVIAVLILAGGGAYLWRNDKASKQDKESADKISSLQNRIDSLEKELASKTGEISDLTAAKNNSGVNNEDDLASARVPSDVVRENVIESITSDNTAALEGYMASSVHVVYAASSGVFDHTPTQAISDIKYLDDAVDPWDFNLSKSVLGSFETGDYKDYFKDNSVVGKSSDGKVIVFNFNDAGKINAIFMSASADLL